MNQYTKEKLDKLSLVELKVIAKELKLSIVGSKKDLIKNILQEFKPQPIVINTHQAKEGRKIVGIPLTDREQLQKMGSMVEKSMATFSYYSMGVVYYETIL